MPRIKLNFRQLNIPDKVAKARCRRSESSITCERAGDLKEH